VLLSLSLPLFHVWSANLHAYFTQNPRLDSPSPVDNASIVARLDGKDSGEASLRIIRFVPISSPHLVFSLFLCSLFLFDYSRYSPLLHSYSRLSAADPVATYRVEQSHSLLRGTEGFGKTRLSDRTASLCYRRKISRDSRMTFTPQREN